MRNFLACGWLFVGGCLFLSAGCGQASGQDAKEGKRKYPVVRMDDDSYKHDFGKIRMGSEVSHVFHFTNTGKAPLVIAEVTTSCGCTTTEYTKEPILPGKKGEVKITFDGMEFDRFTKSIVLHVNTREGRVVLYITGTVVEWKNT